MFGSKAKGSAGAYEVFAIDIKGSTAPSHYYTKIASLSVSQIYDFEVALFVGIYLILFGQSLESKCVSHEVDSRHKIGSTSYREGA